MPILLEVANIPFVGSDGLTLGSNYDLTIIPGTFTITLVASSAQPANGQCVWVVNYGSGVVTIAPSGQYINGGGSSLVLAAGSATRRVLTRPAASACQ